MTFIEVMTYAINSPILLITLLIVIGLAISDGMTDAPNSVATCIMTRAIKPKYALIISAICNALGVTVMAFFSVKVADTIANIANFNSSINMSLVALCSGLVGTIIWSAFVRRIGMPSSESHALIACITGSAIAVHNSFHGINFSEWKKVLFGLAISLIIGFAIGFFITKLIRILFKNSDRRKANKVFKKGQVLGCIFISIMNGAQDGLKFAGILLAAIFISQGSTSLTVSEVPIWISIMIGAFMGLGCLFGGTKVIKTLGGRLTKMETYEGMCVDISSATCLLISNIFGIPISSTHTKSASTMGVGASKRLSSVNWNVAKNMLISWIVVFPCCILLGFILTKILFAIVF